jgi:hypothetical protein
MLSADQIPPPTPIRSVTHVISIRAFRIQLPRFILRYEEQSHAHCRKGVKSIDGHDADENSQERSRGRAVWVKPLFQQKDYKLLHTQLKSLDQLAAFLK